MMVPLFRIYILIAGISIVGTSSLAIVTNLGDKRNIATSLTGGYKTSMIIADNDGQKASTHNEATSKYELSVKPREEIVKLGESILLDVNLRNDSQEVIFIVKTNSINDNKIEVKNGRAETVPLSDEAKKLLERPGSYRRTVHEIKPGEEVRHEYNVSELYSLPAGDTYTIKLKRNVLMADKTHFIEIESNSVKVKVVPGDSAPDRP